MSGPIPMGPPQNPHFYQFNQEQHPGDHNAYMQKWMRCPYFKKDHGQDGKGFKINKCRVIKVPERVIEGRAGETVFIKITLKNNTYKNYKPGVYLVSMTNQFNEDVKMPVENVGSKCEFTLTIPVHIRADAVPNNKALDPKDKEYYELNFGMIKEKGKSKGRGGINFGETICIKVKVLPEMQMAEVFTKAKAIIDASKDDKITFEEAVFALKESNYNADMALDLVIKMRRYKAQQFV